MYAIYAYVGIELAGGANFDFPFCSHLQPLGAMWLASGWQVAGKWLPCGCK